ncbi:MAG: hypothetical protein ACXWLJ_10615 [Rhizomicrobium sp.]
MSDIPPVSNGPVPENQTAAYRAAKMAVIILSVLIVMAVVALVVGGLTRLGGKTASHGPAGAFQLPPGARIVEMQSQPGRLILRVREAHGEQIDILDTQDGRLVGQVKTSFSSDNSSR